MLIRKSLLALILGVISFQNSYGAPGFCQRLLAQTEGFDLFRGDQETIDREALGDQANRAGIRYLAVKVSIFELGQILEKPYHRTGEVFTPVGSSRIGYPFAADLGGVNLYTGGPKLPGEGKNKPLEANPNHNAFIIYTPRLFSLSPWLFGNARALQRTNPIPDDEFGQLSMGNSCVTSNSSDKVRRDAFYYMDGDDNMHRWKVRFDGLLPRYEIMGIIVQPENKRVVNQVLDREGVHADWHHKVHYADTFPDLDPAFHIYSNQQIFEVAQDLGSASRPSARSDGDLYASQAVLKFNSGFPAVVRSAVSAGIAPSLDNRLRPPQKGYGWVGYSAYHERMFDEQGEKLGGYKPSRVGRIRLEAIRDWKFMLVEYTKDGSEPQLVLFLENRGLMTPPDDVPFMVWGIGKRSPDGQSIDWSFKP